MHTAQLVWHKQQWRPEAILALFDFIAPHTRGRPWPQRMTQLSSTKQVYCHPRGAHEIYSESRLDLSLPSEDLG